MNIFLTKLKDNAIAVSLIVVIVFVLNFTIAPIGGQLAVNFLVGSVLIVFGLSFFLLGVDIGIMPLGNQTGVVLAKSKKLWIVVLAGIIFGFVISIAEPGLMVLAEQISEVTKSQISGTSILLFVSVGLAILLSIGFIRIFYDFPLYIFLIIIYILIGLGAIFTPPEFLAIAFDASGSTTGIMAVPFILAMGIGISNLKKNVGEGLKEDSFGLVAIASAGAIIGVFVLNMVTKTTELAADLDISAEVTHSFYDSYIGIFSTTLFDSFMTLLPLFSILILLQLTVFKLKWKAFRRLLIGFGYGFLGMTLFFWGVYGGFMDVGTILGSKLAELDNKAIVVVIGFIIGLVAIIAEPAVYVQTRQIEDVTSGSIKRIAVLVPLCIGVGLAVALSMIRQIVPPIQLWHYLLPGYLISLGLTFFVPKLFVGIAFDAGGVATGPLTATFTLAFTQGAAARLENANLLVDGFGMIAMVALFPIITLQILGLVYKIKMKKVNIPE